MKKTFLRVDSYGGVDWHDCRSMSNHLLENDSMEIQHPEQVIHDYIMKRRNEILEEYKTHTAPDIVRATAEEVEAALKNPTEQTVVLLYGENPEVYTDPDTQETHTYYETCFSLVFSKEEGVLVPTLIDEYYCGQFTTHTWIKQFEIEEDDVRYLVIENFLCPNKGVSTLQRFYTRPVKTYEEAKKIADEMVLHDKDKYEAVWASSVKEIQVISAEYLQTSEWYAKNIQVIDQLEGLEELKKQHKLETELPFAMYVDQHLEKLKDAGLEMFRLVHPSDGEQQQQQEV